MQFTCRYHKDFFNSFYIVIIVHIYLKTISWWIEFDTVTTLQINVCWHQSNKQNKSNGCFWLKRGPQSTVEDKETRNVCKKCGKSVQPMKVFYGLKSGNMMWQRAWHMSLVDLGRGTEVLCPVFPVKAHQGWGIEMLSPVFPVKPFTVRCKSGANIVGR